MKAAHRHIYNTVSLVALLFYVAVIILLGWAADMACKLLGRLAPGWLNNFADWLDQAS